MLTKQSKVVTAIARERKARQALTREMVLATGPIDDDRYTALVREVQASNNATDRAIREAE